MMRLASTLKSRGNICGQLWYQCCTAQYVYGLNAASFSTAGQKVFTGGNGSSSMGQNAFTDANASFSRAGQPAFTGDRVYAAYNVYKGKAALSAEPVPPTFSKREAGGLFIKRSGYIMLSISPSKGVRKYDWERKQKFALSPVEVGSLISLGPTGSCEFFHDPGMLTSNAGQVKKTLHVNANAEGNGYFISLSVADSVKKTNDRLTIPVTSAEFAVMRTSFSFVLPYIMGWDRYTSQSRASEVEIMGTAKMENIATAKIGDQRFESEWDR